MPANYSNPSTPTPGQAVFQYRSRITRRVTEFYPSRGMITVHHEDPQHAEQYERIPRREFLLRAAAISLEVKRCRELACREAGRAKVHYEMARDLQALVDCMIQAARAAGDQGDPTKPGDLKAMADRHRTVAAPGASYETPVPAMPHAPADAPFKDLGGTQVVSPSRLILPG